jgi:Domain of unknown function (DUF3806)
MGLFSFGKKKKEEEAPKMFENIKETPLSDDDLSYISDSLHNADLLIEQMYHGDITEKYSPQILDSVFVVCLQQIDTGDITESMVQNALGAAFGTYLNSDMGSSWLLMTDDYGTDLAVKFKNGGYAFPLATVQKRLESGEVNFFGAIHAAFKKEY